jgi:L-2,4-diaminobutyrate decarboxylase
MPSTAVELGDRLNWSIQKLGLPKEANRFRILCCEISHVTIRQAAALLGLGDQAVVTVETDANYRLCPAALERKLAELQQQDLLPIAIAATAGTTDFGSIDPLPELAACAKAHGLWLHVDAAYGGALILSDRHRHKLAGIEAADSITVDFHKLFYQMPTYLQALKERQLKASSKTVRHLLPSQAVLDHRFAHKMRRSIITTESKKILTD